MQQKKIIVCKKTWYYVKKTTQEIAKQTNQCLTNKQMDSLSTNKILVCEKKSIIHQQKKICQTRKMFMKTSQEIAKQTNL